MDMGVTQRRFSVRWGLGWVSDRGFAMRCGHRCHTVEGRGAAGGYVRLGFVSCPGNYCKLTTLVFEPVCQKVQNFEAK